MTPFVHTLLLAALAIGLAAVLVVSASALGAATRRQRVVLLVLRAAVFLCFVLALLDPQWARSHLWMRLPVVAVLVDTSRSMSIRDAPGEQTRIEHARTVVEGTQRALRHKAQVLLWGFDADARPADVSALEAEGTGTDIAGALRDLRRHVDTERLSAVWLLTDGRDTRADGDDVAGAAALVGVPVNTVGLGSDEQPPDIELWSILAPKSMRTGERGYAVATIRAPGFGGKQIAATLEGPGGQSQAANVTIGGGGTATARFTVAPKQPGMGSYTVSVAPLEAELTDLNNARTFVVSVGQGDRTVLVIDRPRPELKFLRRALDELTGVKADVYLQKAPDGSFWLEGDSPKRAALPSASALRRYDAVVIGDVPAKALPAELLRAAAGFVTERGGGLALLGGPRSFGVGGYAETALADVLPLRLGGTLDGYLPSALRVAAREAADEHPLLPRGEDAIDWSRLPLLEGANLTKGPKPLANVLLEAATSAGRRVPLLAAQRMGAGRGLCMASDSSFRWVFSEYATDESARAHAAFWQRVIRWLSTSTNERPLSIALDKAQCTVGEPVRVIATVLDESFAPVADAQVSAAITRANEKTTIACHPTGDPGRYEGSFRPTADGKHTVQVRAKRGDDDLGSAGSEFAAHTALAELRDVRLNRPLLQRIAEASGGTHYDADAEQAMAQPPPALAAAGRRRISVTRSWPYLILVLLLCGLDWGLRRRWNV